MPSNIVITPASGLIAFTSSSGNTQNITQNSNGTITFSGVTTGVGIGTASPVGALHIVSNNQNLASDAASSYTNAKFRLDPFKTSSIGVSMGLISPNINYIQASYNDGTTAPLSINPYGGNVGIGATPDNTYQGLTIYGSNPSLRLKGSNGSSWTWIEFATSGGTNNFSMGVNQSIPQFVIKAGAGLDSPSFTMSTTGASTFSSTLNIGGVTDIQSARTVQLTLLKLSTTTLSSDINDEISIDFGRGAMSKYSGRISGYLSNFSTYDGGLKFYSSTSGTLNTTPAITINSSNNVGIGITSPLSPLHQVGGGASYTGEARFGGNTTDFGLLLNYTQASSTSGSIYCSPNYSSSGVLFKLGAGAGNTNQLVLVGNGRIGIGTTTPYQQVSIVPTTELATNTSGQFSICESSNNANYRLNLGYYFTGSAYIGFIQAYQGSVGSTLQINPNGGNVGIKNTSPSGLLEVGIVNNNSTYGGHFFSTFQIPVDTWSAVFYVPSNNQWNAITEFTWTSSGDYNRSGAAYMRWAYEGGAATLGVVYTLYNNSQNATATFRKSGNEIQIYITGGVVPYYVQARIQGSQAS